MFEVKDTFDLLRGLLNILAEYEQIKDDPIDKPKMVWYFPVAELPLC